MTVVINNIKWKVGYFSEQEDDGNTWGLTKFSQCKILISKHLCAQARRSTIIHEVCHAFMVSHGFAKTNYDNEYIFSEEQVCEFIAGNLLEIYKTVNKIDTLLK